MQLLLAATIGRTGIPSPNNWNDANWSVVSGGAGRAGIPGVADNVIFDSASAVDDLFLMRMRSSFNEHY